MAQINLSIEILNYGLQLSMEFGQNWLKPINERLATKFPDLLPQQLEEYNVLCKKVHQIAHRFIAENPIRSDEGIEFVDFHQFRQFIQKQYSWLSSANVQRLYSQSCYYAYK